MQLALSRSPFSPHSSSWYLAPGMTAVRPQLEKLGLTEYGDKFVAEGFDTWESLCDITESDLNELSVKLGHRRKLQRAITDYHTRAKTAPLRINHGKRIPQPPSQAEEAVNNPSLVKTDTEEGIRQKRKYRRHPKPDDNAPERPASAYVIFSNHMREQLKGQDLSFTDMAKIVGERWQVLSADSREVYEKQASTAKERYNAALAEYKKTESYALYMEYLADFKAKNAPQDNGHDGSSYSKRVKLVVNDSTGSNNSYESHSSRSSRRKSAIFTPSNVSAESTLSIQESRNSSRSNSYASDGQSPETSSNTLHLPPHRPMPFLKTISRDDTTSPVRRQMSLERYAEPANGAASSPSNGNGAAVNRPNELPFSLARPTSTLPPVYHDSPPTAPSLPPIAASPYESYGKLYGMHRNVEPAHSLSHSHPRSHTMTHTHGYPPPLPTQPSMSSASASTTSTAAGAVAGAAISSPSLLPHPHTPFQKIIDAAGDGQLPRSIRTLPAPDFARSGSAAVSASALGGMGVLPPILPLEEAKGVGLVGTTPPMLPKQTSSLDTLLAVAAKEAERM